MQTNGSFDLPFGPNKLLLGNSSGPLARVTEGWKLGWIFNLVSGPAMDIQAANMLYGNGVPDIVGPFPFDKAGVRWGQDAGTYTGGNYFPTDAFRIAKDPQCANTSIVAASLAANCNLAAVYDATTGQPLLVTPLPGKRGTLGRRVVRGVTVPTFDMNLTKSFRISESKSLQFRIDASNVLNHPIPNTPQLSLAPSAATNALNTSFGQILNATGFSTIGAKTGYRKVQARTSVQLLEVRIAESSQRNRSVCSGALAFAPLFHAAFSQTLQPAVVIIDGGVLIDGNGGPPVRDVQIVIQGNRITAIGRKGQNPRPTRKSSTRTANSFFPASGMRSTISSGIKARSCSITASPPSSASAIWVKSASPTPKASNAARSAARVHSIGRFTSLAPAPPRPARETALVWNLPFNLPMR